MRVMRNCLTWFVCLHLLTQAQACGMICMFCWVLGGRLGACGTVLIKLVFRVGGVGVAVDRCYAVSLLEQSLIVFPEADALQKKKWDYEFKVLHVLGDSNTSGTAAAQQAGRVCVFRWPRLTMSLGGCLCMTPSCLLGRLGRTLALASWRVCFFLFSSNIFNLNTYYAFGRF